MKRQVPELPDPLKFSNGKRVETVDEWLRLRRPELRRLFESEMYGQAPAAVDVSPERLPKVTAHDIGTTLEQWRIRLETPRPTVFHLLLALPARVTTNPLPVLLALNFHGNHTVVRHPAVSLTDDWVPDTPYAKGSRPSEEGRGREAEDWAIDASVLEGFAVATAPYGAIEPDNALGEGGVRAAFGSTSTWGAVAAWAWGLSRILDALGADARLDPSRVVVSGHSRLGKAALLAAAFDDRFAMAAPVQAGCGGTAPSRGTVGETVADITSVFPHWFTARFREYAGRVGELPFDQNALMAMVAPRPLLVPNAVEDSWANPEGQLEALEDASRVYALFGLDGVKGVPRPIPMGLHGSCAAYSLRPGGHRMNAADWATVRAFARRSLPPSD